MSSNKRRPSVDLRRATVQGTTFGDHSHVRDNVFVVGDGQPPPSLDDLREALAAARPQLLASAPTDEARSDVERRLRQLEEELDEDEPAGPVVQSLWARIKKLAGPLSASASIATITDLVVSIFGA
ncbi:MAG: hypothetical protein ACRDRH_27540 [Pseudonocardia sp.]